MILGDTPQIQTLITQKIIQTATLETWKHWWSILEWKIFEFQIHENYIFFKFMIFFRDWKGRRNKSPWSCLLRGNRSLASQIVSTIWFQVIWHIWNESNWEKSSKSGKNITHISKPSPRALAFRKRQCFIFNRFHWKIYKTVDFSSQPCYFTLKL